MSDASGGAALRPGMFLKVNDWGSTRSMTSVASAASTTTLSPKRKWLRKMSARSMAVRWKLDVLCRCPAFLSKADADQRTEAAVKFQRVAYAKGERIGAGVGGRSRRASHAGTSGSAQRTLQSRRISMICEGKVEVVLPLTKRAAEEIIASSRRASAAASALDLVHAAAASATGTGEEVAAAASEEGAGDMSKQPGTPVGGSRPGTAGSAAGLPPLSSKNSWNTPTLDSAASGGNAAWHAHSSLVINTVMEQERQRQRCDGEAVVLSRQSLLGSGTSVPFVFGLQRKVTLRKPPPPPPPKASVTGYKPKQPAPSHNGSEASNPSSSSADNAGELMFANPDHAFDVELVAVGPVDTGADMDLVYRYVYDIPVGMYVDACMEMNSGMARGIDDIKYVYGYGHVHAYTDKR